MREAFSYISSMRRPRHLSGAVGGLAGSGLELGLNGSGRVPNPRQREDQPVRERVDPTLLDLREHALEEVRCVGHLVGAVGQLGRLPGRAGDHPAADLVGDRRGHAVDQLVRLVDDENVVLGQHLPVLEGVDGHERVVRDDDVDVLRGLPGPLDEALGDDRALPAQALVRRDRDLPPRAVADPGDQLVAVARRRRVRPLPQPHHLGPEPGRRRAHLVDGEQSVVLVGEPALELVRAQVVAPALDQRVGRPPPEQRRQGRRDARHVPVDDLGLQCQCRRGHHGGLPGLHRMAHGRHEVRQRLAGPGARLHQQVLTGLHGVSHGVRHLDLARPFRSLDSRYGRLEQSVEIGSHPQSVCRATVTLATVHRSWRQGPARGLSGTRARPRAPCRGRSSTC